MKKNILKVFLKIIKKSKVMKMKERITANDIATLIIEWFNKESKTITNLKLQKLLYFCEAYYMNLTDSSQMFEDNFNALTYGPVALPVYNRFKTFINYPISLDSSKIEIINDDDINQSIETVCSHFENYTASQLVALTHMEGSPWYKVWHQNNEISNYGTKGIIPKNETKKWFMETFLDEQ